LDLQKNKNVAVVGGGFAGLAAARLLKKGILSPYLNRRTSWEAWLRALKFEIGTAALKGFIITGSNRIECF
jgi:glycine/D-amino acid oxidase-like deaminating enzyme